MDAAIYDLVSDYIKNLLIQKFKIGNVKHSLEYAIIRSVYFEFIEYGIGIYANEVYKRVEKKIKAKQKRKKFYAVLDKLAKNGLIIIEKIEGYKVLSVPQAHQNIIFNLINKMQNSNSKFNAFLQRFNEEYIPKPREVRNLALIQFKDKKILDALDREKLRMLFELYLQKMEYNTIVLYHKKFNKLLKIDYKTRFNSASKLYEKIELFYELFDNAMERFNDAVFLTLTLNPNNFNNIYDAAKSVGTALNRFLSYLKKKFGKKITYINVFEFQKNGLIHLHIVLFGFKWLLPQKVLSKLWNKYGMGKIVYLYRLKFDEDEGGFIFDKHKPKDCKENNIADYLVKYLKKAFYDINELSLFWLTNKRFFTYSRDLKEKKEEIHKHKVGFDFVGVFKRDVLDALDESDFIASYIYGVRKIKYGIMGYGGGYG